MEENKIPEAMEFATFQKIIDGTNKWQISQQQSLANILREFAKLHVEAALLAASEKGTLLYPDVMGFQPIINPDSILNAYPLENIK